LKRRAVGVSSFLLLLLMIIVYAGAYLTGLTDGKEAAKVLSPEAKEVLTAHKQLGIYLVYGSLVVLLFKLISAAVKKVAARLVFLVILILFTLAAFNEGKKGGELVYKYGANVQAVRMTAPETPQATDQKTQKASESVAAPKEEAEVKSEAAVPSKATEEVKHEAKKTTTEVKDAAEKAAETETIEKAKEVTKKAVETVKEKAVEAVEKAKETVKEVVKPASETPVKKITPVETIPAG